MQPRSCSSLSTPPDQVRREDARQETNKQMGITQVHTNGNKSAKAKTNGNASPAPINGPADGGKLIVLTAPLTETIDHAGYFIQMGMASMPIWMEGVLNRKYPNWRDVELNDDGSARYMPAGTRVLEASLQREFKADDMVACLPDDLHK